MPTSGRVGVPFENGMNLWRRALRSMGYGISFTRHVALPPASTVLGSLFLRFLLGMAFAHEGLDHSRQVQGDAYCTAGE